VLSRTLFENVNSLFANESDGYKTRSAPSAFRFSCGRSARTRQELTTEQSECYYRNRHQEDLSHRCRGRHRGSPASVLQSQHQETSSAADPATVFDRVRFPSHPQIISDQLSPFANNVQLYISVEEKAPCSLTEEWTGWIPRIWTTNWSILSVPGQPWYLDGPKCFIADCHFSGCS